MLEAGFTVPEQWVKPGDAEGEKIVRFRPQEKGSGFDPCTAPGQGGHQIHSTGWRSAGLSQALLSPSVQPAARGVLLPPGSNYVPLNFSMSFL